MEGDKKASFEWDKDKNRENIRKHGVSFEEAQLAFFDPKRLIYEDITHSIDEQRYFCFGRIDNEVVTVRFTYRDEKIRVFGAGYWRKGKKIYCEVNS
jgi:uncharacterized protein